MILDQLEKLTRPLLPARKSIVLDVLVPSVPFPQDDGPFALGRGARFTPARRKGCELLAELSGSLTLDPDAKLPIAYQVLARVNLLAGGEPLPELLLIPPVRTARIAAPIGLLEPGKPITITATSWRSEGVASVQASLRIVVVEFA